MNKSKEIKIKNDAIYRDGIKIATITTHRSGAGVKPPEPFSIENLTKQEMQHLFKTLSENLKGLKWKYPKLKEDRRFLKYESKINSLYSYYYDTKQTSHAMQKRISKVGILLSSYPSDGKPVLAIIPNMMEFLFLHYFKLEKKSDYTKRKILKDFVPLNLFVAYTIAFFADTNNFNRDELSKAWKVLFSHNNDRNAINLSKLPDPLPKPLI